MHAGGTRKPPTRQSRRHMPCRQQGVGKRCRWSLRYGDRGVVRLSVLGGMGVLHDPWLDTLVDRRIALMLFRTSTEVAHLSPSPPSSARNTTAVLEEGLRPHPTSYMCTRSTGATCVAGAMPRTKPLHAITGGDQGQPHVTEMRAMKWSCAGGVEKHRLKGKRYRAITSWPSWTEWPSWVPPSWRGWPSLAPPPSWAWPPPSWAWPPPSWRRWPSWQGWPS